MYLWNIVTSRLTFHLIYAILISYYSKEASL